MDLIGDDRAQSIQVGAVLLFGILIVFLALYQATVVPDQNEEIEFDHNQELQEQMTELRSALVSMPGTANTRSTSLDLGVRYPSRTIFVNPGPASGSIRTVGTTDSDHSIRISGAKAADDEPAGVESFWDGETVRSYNTGSIAYQPGYNQYTNAPRTILEHSVVLNDFGNSGSIPLTSSALIDDDRLTLVAINGSLSQNRVGRSAVDITPKGTNTQTVALEPQNENITVELPITAGESGWEEALEDFDEEGMTVEVEEGVVELTISEDADFTLELAKVGVGTGATGTDATYIRDATNEDGTATVTEGKSTDLTVEVRDDYNNPKRGVTVNASASEGSVEESKETRGNGEATFEYDASGVDPGEYAVNFTITEGYEPDATHDSGAPENITITVDVKEESETGAGATDPRYNIAFNEPSIQTQPGVEYDEEAEVYTVFAEAMLDTDITDANTNEPVAFATADYTMTGSGVGSIAPSTNDTNRDGETATVLKRGGFEDENEVQTRIELAQDELDVRYNGVQINFQPPDALVDDAAFDDVDGFEPPYRTPPGFINDTGLAKTEQHNLNYGWDVNWADEELYRPIEGNSRDNIADFENPLINGTFNHWVDNPAEDYDSNVHPSWSIDLPDGFYEVTIAGGDSDNADQNVSFRVGNNIEDFTDEEFDDETNTRPENGFVKHTGIVEVTDGELVIQPPDGTYNPKLSWLRIVPSEPPAESQLDNLDIAGQGIDATIAEGDDEDISVDVENVGEQDGEFDLTLEIGGDVVDTEEDVVVAAGGTTTVTFDQVTGDLEPGDYDVVVSTEDDEIEGTLTVEDSVGSFSGVVVDEQGDAIEEEVTFEDESGAELGVETPDSGDGSYTVENVPVGTYDVTATASGFEPETFEGVEIEEGEETENIDFTLASTDDAVLTVEEFIVDDQQTGEEFDITVDITESADIETVNFEVELVIEDDGTEISEETQTVSPGEIQDETVTVTFEDVGGLDAGEDYEAIVTADADNAEADTGSDTFNVRGPTAIVDEQADPESIAVGEETTISAIVEDQFGDPFEGEEVTFTHDGEGTFEDGSSVSNEDGEVSDIYTAVEDDAGRDVTVTLSAETDGIDDVTVTFEVEEITQPTLNADDSNIDPNEVTEGDEDDYVATVELEDLDDVTEDGNEVTVTLINYDGGDTDIVESTTFDADDVEGDNTLIVDVDGGDFDGVEAPEEAEYDVVVDVSFEDDWLDDIEGEEIDTITVSEQLQNELYPNEELDSENLEGEIDDLRENNEDDWYEAIDDREDTSLRVGMDDPAANIDGQQTIQFHLRQDSSPRGRDGDPEAEFYLYEDGEEIIQLGGTESVTTTEGETFTLTFDADEIDDPNDVEFRIDGFENGGPGGNAVTVEVGYITWEPAA